MFVAIFSTFLRPVWTPVLGVTLKPCVFIQLGTLDKNKHVYCEKMGSILFGNVPIRSDDDVISLETTPPLLLLLDNDRSSGHGDRIFSDFSTLTYGGHY